MLHSAALGWGGGGARGGGGGSPPLSPCFPSLDHSENLQTVAAGLGDLAKLDIECLRERRNILLARKHRDLNGPLRSTTRRKHARRKSRQLAVAGGRVSVSLKHQAAAIRCEQAGSGMERLGRLYRVSAWRFTELLYPVELRGPLLLIY